MRVMFLTNVSIGLQACFDLVAVEDKKAKTIRPSGRQNFAKTGLCETTIASKGTKCLISGFGGINSKTSPLVNVVIPEHGHSCFPFKLAREINAVTTSLASTIATNGSTSGRISAVAINATPKNSETFKSWAKSNGVSIESQAKIAEQWLYEYSSVSARIRKRKIEDSDKTGDILFIYDTCDNLENTCDNLETDDDKLSFVPGFSIKIKVSESSKKLGISFEDKQYVNRLIRLLDMFVSFPQVALGPRKGFEIRRKYGFTSGLFRVLSSKRLEYMGASPSWLRNETMSRWLFGSTILAVKMATAPNLYATAMAGIDDNLIQNSCNKLDSGSVNVLQDKLISNLKKLPAYLRDANNLLNPEMFLPWQFFNQYKDTIPSVLQTFMPARTPRYPAQQTLHGALLGGDTDSKIVKKYKSFIKTCS